MLIRRFSSINSLAYALEESSFDKLHRKKKPKKDPFFWSFEGIEPKEPKIRFLPDRMIVVNKISFPKLIGSLYDQFEVILKSISEMNILPARDLLEPNLYNKINLFLDTLKQQSKTLKLTTDPKFSDEKPTMNVIDGLIYRGLSIDRSQNKPLSNYHVYFDEGLGIVCYTDKLLSNPLGYANQDLMEQLHAKNRLTVLQLLVWIKSPYMIRIFEGDKDVSNYNMYTYNQQWVFETQCSQPPWLKKEEKTETYMEWISKFKPSNFIVSDINDMMELNPLITNSS